MSKNNEGRLLFSNPAHPDSGYTPVMKDLSEVPAFSTHDHASARGYLGKATTKVAVYEVKEDIIYVTPERPLIISGDGPVRVTFDTVIILPGGQIQIYTAAEVHIDKLEKK